MGRATRDAEQALGRWELPPEARALVLDLVRRARLRWRERIELVQELASHFDEGLARGVTVDALIEQFGDPAACASELRSAILGKRSATDRAASTAIKIAAPLFVALTVAYAAYGLWLAQQQPKVTVDLEAALGALNDGAAGSHGVCRVDPALLTDTEVDRLFRVILEGETEGTEFRHAVAAWGERHAAAIVALRSDSKVGEVGPAEAGEVARGLAAGIRALSIDSWQAAATGDGARVLANATAIDALAAPAPSLCTWSEGAVLRVQALKALSRILDSHAATLSLDALGSLRSSPLLAVDNQRSLTLAMTAERLRFDDFLQRHFTDDGAEGGVVLPAERDMVTLALAPALAVFTPSRRETQAAADRLHVDVMTVILTDHSQLADMAAERLKATAKGAAVADPFSLMQSFLATFALRARDLRLELARLRADNLDSIERAISLRRSSPVR